MSHFGTLAAILAFAFPTLGLAQEGGGRQLSLPELMDQFENQIGEGREFEVLCTEQEINVLVGFDFDSAVIRDDQRPKLAALCRAMKQVDQCAFRLIGHTDSAGSIKYNKALSELRASEVKRHLTAECEIDAYRLETMGVGEEQPLVPDHPEAEANRRVEFEAVAPPPRYRRSVRLPLFIP